MYSRRQFSRNVAGAAALGVAAPAFGSSSRLLVNAPTPQFFVFVQVYGAWDVCLAFDPKDRDTRLSTDELAFDQPYAFNEVSSVGNGLRLAPGGLPLAPFADRMAFINGIDMEIDNGHQPIIMMTGDPQALGTPKPSIQALVSEKHPYVRQCLMPHLYASYDGFFAGGSLVGKTVTISRLDAHRVLFSAGGSGSLRRAETMTRSAASDLGDSARQRVGLYGRALARAAVLRDTLSGRDDRPLEPPVGPTEFGAFTAALFKLGILGSLTWSIGEAYFFDTHGAHYAQHPLKQALQDVADFCDQLKMVAFDDHSSVLDHTTVVMTGEFARTPRLNSANGKDHNFRTNSMLLIGQGVRPGVYGASGERLVDGKLEAHAGLPVDFATGVPAANGAFLKARNLWAGCGGLMGVDLRGDFGADTRPVTFLGG